MWIYRVNEPRLGAMRMREWRRRTRHAAGLLLLVLIGAVTGLMLLDQSNAPFSKRLFTALWDGVNLVTTLGDFSDFDDRQKSFMLLAMFATLLVGGFALSRLTGLMSGDDVMVFRENRAMERKLESLANHVVVVGFRRLGELIAHRLRDAGETVLVLVGDQSQAERASDRGYLVVVGEPDVFDNVLEHARLDSAKAVIVTTPNADNNLSITLMVHTLNPALAIAVFGDNDLRKVLLERAGASDVVVADELVANALLEKLTTRIRSKT